MGTRAIALSVFVCGLLIAAAMWLFEMSLERAAVLAPVIVLAAGAAAGLVVLWLRVVLESVRGRARTK